MSELRIELATPDHGWITVELQLSGETITCAASSIVDSLTDLTYAALELVEGRPVRPVVLFEEPSAIRLSLKGEGDVVSVEVTRHKDLAAAQNGRAGSLVLVALLGRLSIARAIWSALRRLEGAIGRERTDAGWQRSFPAKEVAHLGERLRDRASSSS